jgi:hypothetical protein
MINNNIRFFKPNDPYYYEVDNLPIDDLISNCVDLQNQLNVLVSEEVYSIDTWLEVFLDKTIYEARTLFDTPGLTGVPTEGDGLAFQDGEWTPKLLFDAAPTVFSDISMTTPNSNTNDSDKDALIASSIGGTFVWKSSNEVTTDNYAVSSWLDIQDMTDWSIWQGYLRPQAWPNATTTDSWMPTNGSFTPLMFRSWDIDGYPDTDYPLNPHYAYQQYWSTGLSSLNETHNLPWRNHVDFDTRHRCWNFHPVWYDEEILDKRFGFFNPLYPPSKENPYVTKDAIVGGYVGGSLVTQSLLDEITEYQMQLSSLSYAAANEPRKSRMNLVNLNGQLWGQGSYTAPGGLIFKWAKFDRISNADQEKIQYWDDPFPRECIHASVGGHAHQDSAQPDMLSQIHGFNRSSVTMRLQEVARLAALQSGIILAIGY